MNDVVKSKDKPFSFRGKYLLLVVAIAYAVLFIFNQLAAVASLQKSGSVLAKILPIIVIVILLTALINYFLRPKQIARHLGHDAGIKAWFWSLLGGVFSHGPVYVWFPLLDDLRRHGMRDSLIVVFIYARAVKLPILPIMIDYFGWLFTLVLSVYILIGSIIQGWILEVIERR